MTCRSCFTSDEDDHYQGFYVECNCEFIFYDSDYCRYLCYHNEFNNIITYELIIGSIFNYDTWMCKITILPLNMQNYHFAPEGDFLGLIFKITISSYLRKFHDYVIYFAI